ncbi:hypothetical protein H9N28_11125 [Rhodobacter capsulatus]|uniref:hypothetical protein n=1 Tax=Rhodobacter capsulatus TaxID=1061 RepID=UPI0006DBE579|nr:hypothetical protein [Rhodobacter capsulatus]KQB12099.1 hypothetical protein AP071_09160 [Rhodobacter capsulatus]KQB16145.1 hypothetical protein AP073_11130 [Rhodobacter capsulatus]PZX22100.1 hypothetical protein LY44_03097 [Rhodobacter capsulatus]QNR62137.1 hypothetical protein H9N28_11125 [Rhodobacter capsulatus]
MSKHDDEDQPRSPGRGEPGVGATPPVGWYYFGPEPPWVAGCAPGWGPQAGPGQGGAGWGGAQNGPNSGFGPGFGAAPGPQEPDNRDLMQAFDRLARGDVSAETLGMLFNLRDRDFWKGAVAGSAVALALANLPALKAMFAGLAAQGFGMGGMGAMGTPPAAAKPAPTTEES